MIIIILHVNSISNCAAVHRTRRNQWFMEPKSRAAEGGSWFPEAHSALGLWVQSLDPADALLTEISRGGCASVCAVVAACLLAGGLGGVAPVPRVVWVIGARVRPGLAETARRRGGVCAHRGRDDEHQQRRQ